MACAREGDFGSICAARRPFIKRTVAGADLKSWPWFLKIKGGEVLYLGFEGKGSSPCMARLPCSMISMCEIHGQNIFYVFS
jgi:hypothetical protein